MKKIAIAALLSSFVAAPAFAADDGFYAGVTLGRSSTGNIAANTAMTKSTNTVAGILAGYQFTKNWGAEAFYTGSGKFSATTGAVKLTGKSDTWGVNAVGTLPLSDAFSLYGKLGVASTKTTVSSVPLSNAAGASRSTATIGLGAIYNVTPAIGMRFGWDRYGASVVAAPVTNKFNTDVWSLGAVFKF